MSKYSILHLLPAVLLVPTQAHGYSTSISLTSDAALAKILADIPLLSVGLVAFGVYTFFFIMRRLNKVTTYIHLSVLLAFLAAIFDLSQIVRRGYFDTMYDLNISSVQVLVVLRELGHALSFGFRYLSFWFFVAEPPRGELPFVPMQDDRRPNFISLSSEEVIHSGDWTRLKLMGIILKWTLLLLTLSVTVLQILWRLVNAFRTFGPIYVVEAGIEIGLSVAFISKVAFNSFISPLHPRWHTFRDYSAFISAMLIGMGVAIGNLLCFRFSESTLGRFLQAVELYTLILFVLISAFYKMPVRSSVVAELVRRRLTAAGFGDIEATPGANNRQSQLSMVQAPYSMPTGMGTSTDNDNSRPAVSSNRPSFTQRISSSSIFSSRLMPRRGGSGQVRAFANAPTAGDAADQRRLWDGNAPEASPSPSGQRSFRASLEQTPEQTPNAPTRDAPGWKDPVFTSVMPTTRTETSYPASVTIKGKERRASLPQIVVPDDASQYTNDRFSALLRPSQFSYSRDDTDSPVYGLDGIIRNLQRDGKTTAPIGSDFSSARSSGIESLLRQQKELDKSLAGLRRFSTTSTNRVPVSRMQSNSLQSDISLSNFPSPPAFLRSVAMSDSESSMVPSGLRAIEEDRASVPETEADRSKSIAVSAISDNSMIVDDVAFQLVPPRMPAVLAELPGRSQNQSIPSISRESLDSVLEETNTGRAMRLGSQGTQYDVTSFIGGLSAPGADRLSPLLTEISERERYSDSASESVVPATITELSRVQIVDKGRPSEDDVPDSGIGESNNTEPLFVLFPPPTAPSEPEPRPQAQAQVQVQGQAQSQPQGLRPLLMTGGKQLGLGRSYGLPTGPRGRLEISNPIQRNSESDVLKERNAFQRPRPAPLVLQNANDNRPTAPDPPRNDGYF